MEAVEDLQLVELQDLESLGLNKLERVRFQRCIEQLRCGRSTDSHDSSDGNGTVTAAGRHVTLPQESRPVGAASAERWDQSNEIGGGSLDLGAHGWWRIDGDDEQLARVDHAGRGWIDGRPATFALENEDEEFEKVVKSLKRCDCFPSVSSCIAGAGLGWFATSLLMLAYVHMQSSVCPSGAAGPPTPILQASPTWGQIRGTKAGEQPRRVHMEDFQIELFRNSDASSGDVALSPREVSEGARVHGWLTTAQVGAGIGSTLKAVYCPGGGRSLARLEEAGALDEIVTGACAANRVLSGCTAVPSHSSIFSVKMLSCHSTGHSGQKGKRCVSRKFSISRPRSTYSMGTWVCSHWRRSARLADWLAHW